MTYSKPNTSPEYRADAAECLDRAQRSLEVAEVNLDTIAEQLNAQGRSLRGADPTHVIAHAEARTRLGDGWLALAMVKGELR